MKKAVVAVSILIHALILFLVLPVETETFAQEEEDYRYLSINAVLVKDQPPETLIPPSTPEQKTERPAEQEKQDNYLISDSSMEDDQSDNANFTEENNKSDYYPLSKVHVKPSLIEMPDFEFPRSAKLNNITATRKDQK